MQWKQYLPLLSEKAVQLFEQAAPGCAEYREFLSLRGRRYYVLNVLALEDTLDMERSEISRYEDGRIRAVRRYYFDFTSYPKPIFKLANVRDGTVFVSNAFARAILDAGLLGFEFRDPAVNETALLFRGDHVGVMPD